MPLYCFGNNEAILPIIISVDESRKDSRSPGARIDRSNFFSGMVGNMKGSPILTEYFPVGNATLQNGPMCSEPVIPTGTMGA